MMKKHEVEVVIVGNELLKGDRRDAHLSCIGRALAGIGARVGRATVVGDEPADIADAVRSGGVAARAVIVCGGLGPTHDDVTREGVAEALELPLEFDPAQWQAIEALFRGFGREPDESNRSQACFPRGSTVVPNRRGSAAGFMIEQAGCLVAVLPGPPRELTPMLEGPVIDRLRRLFDRPPLFQEIFRTTGIGESDMTPLVRDIFDRFDEFGVSSLPHPGGVDIVITQKPHVTDTVRIRDRAAAFEAALRSALGEKVYAKGTDELEAVVGRALADRGATLAIAESLTGGLVGKRITDVPGSSRYLLADVVAYSNASKVACLDVREQSIETHGAVSETVCREMADGIRHRTGATYAIATTGIAGPDGGSREKPVGLTYYGLTWEGGADVHHRVFPGSREDVRRRAAFAALFLLHRWLAADSR